MSTITRRQVLAGAGSAVVAASAVTGAAPSTDDAAPAGAPVRATKGRVKQSLVWWCYQKHWNGDVERLCEATKGLGVRSIELIEPAHWPTLKKHGLVCAI